MIFLTYILFIFQKSEKEMKSNFKCRVCNKVLASKQNIVKHLAKLHPDSDKTQYSVVQVAREENESTKKQTKAKSAYSYFSGMKNIFSDRNLCKDISLYSHDSNNTSVPDPTENQDISNSSEASKNVFNNIKTGKEDNQEEMNIQEDEFLPHPSSSSNEVLMSPSPSVISETNSDFLITELDTAFDESPPPTPDNVSVSGEPHSLEDMNPPPPSLGGGTPRFKPPFKTRGGCGCEKCRRDNCGNCYNCLNRS